jgi:3-hydroxybutyryl-CoA dehydrogenase
MIDTSRTDLILGVVGAGTMGRGIAQVAATGGINVLLFDARQEAVSGAVQFIAKMINRAAEKGSLSAAQASQAIERVRPVSSLSGLSPCHVVIEAVAEDLTIKQELFSSLETIVSDDCIIASNTSAIPITNIAAKCRRPQRVAGTHFFNPVPLMRLVEIINGLLTDTHVADALAILTKRMGREPVRCADFAGFLAGNIGRGLTLEAARIVEHGIATFEDVDNVVRDVLGFPMGPFQLIDNNGADIVHRAMEAVYKEFYHEPYFRPSALIKQRVTAGLLGKKSGTGFFAYKDGKVSTSSSTTPTFTERPKSVWISPEFPNYRDKVEKLLTSLDAVIDSGNTPDSGALCIVTPVGEDATTSILKQNLNPKRTIALDALFDLSKRRTCMTNPALSKEALSEALGLLTSDGQPVTVIHDSSGFIAQRIIAMIINVGCWIAESKFASPDDIDKAALLGLGYPKGPFSLADEIGPSCITSLLTSIQMRTGDARYRPSPWLTRRSDLGLSLRTL